MGARLKKFFEAAWCPGAISRFRLLNYFKEATSCNVLPLELIQVHILKRAYGLRAEKAKLEEELLGKDLSFKERFYITYFSPFFSKKIVDQFLIDYKSRPLSHNDLMNLLDFDIPGQVMIYVICSEDRSKPAKMVIKNRRGQFLDKNFECLVHGRANKPYCLPNGSTPAGVFKVNGVMPFADNQKLFGKYRRLVVDFIGDEKLQLYLPENVKNGTWFLPAQIAKRLGRKHLRIHGTGLRNRKFWKPFYPHVTTSGCISMREGKTLDDQQELLSSLLEAQQLEETFENQTKISAVLYILEIEESEFHSVKI